MWIAHHFLLVILVLVFVSAENLIKKISSSQPFLFVLTNLYFRFYFYLYPPTREAYNITPFELSQELEDKYKDLDD